MLKKRKQSRSSEEAQDNDIKSINMKLDFNRYSNVNFDRKTSVHTSIVPNYQPLIIQCCSDKDFTLTRWNAFIEQMMIYLSVPGNYKTFQTAARDFDMTDDTVYRAVFENHSIFKTDPYQLVGELVSAHLFKKNRAVSTQVSGEKNTFFSNVTI